AERVLVGKVIVSKGLVDDCDARRTLVILRREAASTQQRNLHRRKIVLARHLQIGVVPCGGHHRLARQQDVGHPVVLRDKRYVTESRRAYSWQVIQPLKKPLVELHQPFVFVTRLSRLQSEEQQVLLVETQVDSLEVVKCADVQSGADQQQQRHRYLRDDQPF